MALDLSEILDISEVGLCIQSSAPLQVGSTVNLCLDLSETRSHIYTTGQVVWTDRSGRAGLRFPGMPDSSLRQLREWLFLNLVVACVNHVAARAVLPGDFAGREIEEQNMDADAAHELTISGSPDYTSILSGLAAVRREAELLGTDLEKTLQLLADRALVFTGASGAAIALGDATEMVCRASAGQDAPGPGVRLQVDSGFSGECVRTGRLMRCDDSENDPYVDRDICRALGIRSILAAPITSGNKVTGILEVFAPTPHAFSGTQVIILQRMSEYAAEAVERSTDRGENAETAKLKAFIDGSDSDAEAAQDINIREDDKIRVPAESGSYFRKGLFIAAIVTCIFAGAWLLYPRANHKVAPVPIAASTPQLASKAIAPTPALSFDALRQLAQKGDAASEFAVGVHYATGEDVAQDYREAVRWFAQSAEQGHVVAQATLGAYYWAGRGVPQDLGKAYFWSVLAQAGGDEASKYRVAVLASRMTRSQILIARQQADDWLKQHQVSSQNPPATH